MTSSDTGINIMFVCTGNAARSVMGAAMLRKLMPHVTVTSGGTHSIPGLPMSVRTKKALDSIDVADLDHRSAQVEPETAESADLIVIFEPMHIMWTRRHVPQVAARTASLPYLAANLGPGPLATLDDRIARMGLGERDFEDWEEVVDPAGGDLPVFEAAASQIRDLVIELVARIDSATAVAST